ncbi:serpin B [Tangfeifania diversioriginum]|uniref:Serpin B n=1 Tax=Tangfeifania diversioriginum TaxID=1168035 RepID=A0A1M6JRP3_9BACT|nr:serpin family protein [Tangfeifania diversioriginum]SHJ49316.1 serpin B [Tangfeifania diversioriginum]
MKRRTIIILIATLLFTACNIADDEGIYTEIELTEKSAQLVEADNEFGFELFQKVYSAEKKYENIMVSPLSVSLALAMTYNGANAETKIAMEETLKLYGLTPDEINTSYQTLIEALKSLDKKVVLEIANAIFYRDDFSVEPDFVSVNQNYYDAEVSALDFESPDALKTINGWVAEKTKDKIESILDRITPDNVMFLLNAIYFKGIWASEFEKKNTVERDFHLENGAAIQTDFMQQENPVLYNENDLFQAIQLPYGQGNFSMSVFLPQVNKSLQDVMENLDKENWKSWMENFSERNVKIQLPKFKYEYEIKLNDILSEMGMRIAFTGGADFTGINKNADLYIDYVKHKSFIEVNEEGTEAAAVTVVAVNELSAGGGGSIPFNANRPFLFAITEKSTGAILFVGTVKNPQKN